MPSVASALIPSRHTPVELAVDLTHYPSSMPDSASLAALAPASWIALAAMTALVAGLAAARRSRFSWLAAALAVMAASPRLIFYDATYLLVALPARSRATTDPS